MRAFPFPFPFPASRWLRRTAATTGAAAAAVLMTATAASAAGPGFYALSGTPGATFQQLKTGDLVNIDTDDSLFPLSTSGQGLGKLPFPVHAYDQTYQNLVVDSNGNIRLGANAGRQLSQDHEQCLPSTVFGVPVIAVYWDDLDFRTADTSHGFPDGIFTRTAGTAPHRTFTVSWQGEELDTHRSVLAQVTFAEGSQKLTFVYGTDGAASATVGVQSKEQLSSTEWTCDSGATDAVTAGLRIVATHHEGMPPAN